MLNILIVERRHQQRSEIHSSLVKAGNSVVLADTPDKVEMALTHRRYKLVIFDMNSAGMGLLKTVIAEKYEAKLLLLSTRDQFAECLQGFNLGADDYIDKPIVPDCPVKLTPSEYRILELLLKNQSEVLSHQRINVLARGKDSNAPKNSTEAHICSLRRKLHRHGLADLIRTQRGFGYFIEPQAVSISTH